MTAWAASRLTNCSRCAAAFKRLRQVDPPRFANDGEEPGMAAIVSLRDVVDEMEMANESAHPYINRATGELFTVVLDMTIDMDEVEDDDDFADHPEWQRELLVKA